MDFDNIFDSELSAADDIILDTMGKRSVYIAINGEMVPITAVFDDPEADTSLMNQAAKIHDTAPTLFLKSALVADVQEKAIVKVGNNDYWVVNVGPDDGGSCVITLARGRPGRKNQEITQWSK